MTRHFRGRMINARVNIYESFGHASVFQLMDFRLYLSVSKHYLHAKRNLAMHKFCFTQVRIRMWPPFEKYSGKIIIAVGVILRRIRLYMIPWISTRHHLYRSCGSSNICINYATLLPESLTSLGTTFVNNSLDKAKEAFNFIRTQPQLHVRLFQPMFGKCLWVIL